VSGLGLTLLEAKAVDDLPDRRPVADKAQAGPAHVERR
jgi:hypothetical protein